MVSLSRHVRVYLALAFLILSLPVLSPSATSAQNDENGSGPSVSVIRAEGIINQIVANFILTEIERAERSSAEALIIQLDTPGGLDISMREIVKDILNSEVPVVVYVSPSGARAASAGVFLTYASHLAAMAPGTNIGAAHPVNLGGDIPEEQEKKVVNDAAAYIKAIAKQRGRNEQWAEAAVRQSVSLTSEDAVKQDVVDILAPSVSSLLEQIDGREVTTISGTKILDTADAGQDKRQMSFRQNLFHTLTDPNIAYLLLILGTYGIIYELANPGFGAAGIGGAIALILGMYALHVVGVNYAGLALIVFAFALFIADIFTPTQGVLTGGGVISLLIGSLILIDAPRDQLSVSLSVIIPVVLVTALFSVFAVGTGMRAQRRRVESGMEGIIGELGLAETRLATEGQVLVKGERWRAQTSTGTIEKGDKVKVVGFDGLKLEVTRADS